MPQQLLCFRFRFSSIGSQSFGDEADQEDNDVDDEEEVAAARERDDQDQGKHLVGFSFNRLKKAGQPKVSI